MTTEKLSNSNVSELRKFGIVMGIAFMIVLGILIPLLKRGTLSPFCCSLGAVFFILAFLWPASLKPVHQIWIKLGHILGWINTRIILGFVFFACITPISLIMRLWGRDPLHRKWLPDVNSYRMTSKPIKPKNMEVPY